DTAEARQTSPFGTRDVPRAGALHRRRLAHDRTPGSGAARGRGPSARPLAPNQNQSARRFRPAPARASIRVFAQPPRAGLVLVAAARSLAVDGVGGDAG